MANRIVYSCNSSDMDVSDSDDGAQMCQQEESTVSKSDFAHSFTRMDTDGYDSDNSFHTANMSPRISSEELEPGQISDSLQTNSTPPLDPLEIECRELETKLQFYQGKISDCDQELKKLNDAQERIRIQLLEYEVRDSIARNRKPNRPAKDAVAAPTSTVIREDIRPTPSTSKDMLPTRPSRNYPHRRIGNVPDLPTGTLATAIVIDVPVPPTTTPTTTSQRDVLGSPTSTPATTYTPYMSPPTTISTELMMEDVLPNTKQVTEQLTQSSLSNSHKRLISDSESTSVPSLRTKKRNRRLKKEKKEKTLLKNKTAGPSRLKEAIIDIPLSARYVQKIRREDASSSDEETTINNMQETKRNRKMREKDEMITDEERALISPDTPPYPPRRGLVDREATKKAHAEVTDHLRFNPPSIKNMRISLLNLMKTSIIQCDCLSGEQEEFAKSLIRKILRLIEDYMILPEEVYRRPLRLQPPEGPDCDTLPERFYGNLGTLSYDGPDVSHHELYKAIRYFANITNASALRKADQFLLTSGRNPPQRILRTCDPANPDETSTIPFDLHTKNNPEVQAMLLEQSKGKGRETKSQKKKRLQKQAGIKKSPMQIDNETNAPPVNTSPVQPQPQPRSQLTSDDEIDINRLYDYYSKKQNQSQSHSHPPPKEIITIDDDELKTPPPLSCIKDTPLPITVDIEHNNSSDSQKSPILSKIPAVAQPDENPTFSTSTQV